MRLTLAKPMDEKQTIDMDVYLPVDDVDHYSAQTPMRVSARIAWQRPAGQRTLVGIEFINVNSAINDRLKDCFSYFNKHPEYQR